MKALPRLRVRVLALYLGLALSFISFVACNAERQGAVKATISQCVKAEENKLVDQATKALLVAMSQDPQSISTFLSALVLDAAQAGVSDAVSFVTCVAEAARAKLIELATHASIDPERYAQALQALDSWEAAHPTH